MRKFCVFSGFLGSGKTTTMMAVTRYYSEHHGKAAMISNDVGHGVTLADNKLANLCGCNASEMTETCICYQNENLADRLNSYYDDGCDLVLSDIPGFGVGALEHVYHGLTEKFPGQFELAPFTVVVEPKTIGRLRKGSDDLHYILDTQLAEADLILLNKCDTINEEQIQADKEWLAAHYPEASVIAISALKGEGMEELSRALKSGQASMRRPDIGYGGQAFRAAMGKISELYLQYYATVCCNDFDGNAYLADLAAKVQESFKASEYDIPHLKLLAWTSDGDFGKADLLGSGQPVEMTRRFERPCTEIAVLLNGSAVCPAEKLDEIIDGSAKEISANYNLEMIVHKREFFGMGA